MPVTVAAVVEKPMPVVVSAVGNVQAYSSVSIRAQVTGQLTEVHFSEGQDVAAGQLLFTLDPRPFEAAVKQAEAVLARDRAQAANAQAQAARASQLQQRGILPRDQAETQATNASALQAAVAADEAQLENAKLQLQYSRITAPVAGRTGQLGVHRGDLIRANDTTPMVVINQVSPIYVAFSVPGRVLPDVRKFSAAGALRVDAAVAGTTQPPAEGKVTFIDNGVDPTSGTIRIKATFGNRDRRLWPGDFVNIGLRLTTEPNALVVPTQAIQTSQQGDYVFAVRADRTVEMRPVRVARTQGDEAVVASGLKAGEEVVTDGQLRLTPGARISVRQPAAAARTVS